MKYHDLYSHRTCLPPCNNFCLNLPCQRQPAQHWHLIGPYMSTWYKSSSSTGYLIAYHMAWHNMRYKKTVVINWTNQMLSLRGLKWKGKKRESCLADSKTEKAEARNWTWVMLIELMTSSCGGLGAILNPVPISFPALRQLLLEFQKRGFIMPLGSCLAQPDLALGREGWILPTQGRSQLSSEWL